MSSPVKPAAEPLGDSGQVVHAPPPPPGKAAPEEPAVEPPPAEDRADGDEDLVGPLPLWIRAAPPWLVSTVVHALLLMALALFTYAVNQREPPPTTVLVSEPAELEEFDLAQTPPVELEELKSDPLSFDAPELAPQEPLEIDAETELDPLRVMFSPASLDSTSLLSEIRSITGRSRGRGNDFGGKAGLTTFFGTKAQARRVAFVVDNSNSMGRGRLETALLELKRSIDALNRKQQFFLVFFSDTAYPMFHPRGERKMIRATEENKRRIGYWLDTVERCLRTDALEAVQMALAMRPDVIYILGDGAFTDRTARILIRNPARGVTIHTLGMQVPARVRDDFEAIAKRHKGTFKDVGVSAAGRALFRRGPRTPHRTRGKVWGLKLPKAR